MDICPKCGLPMQACVCNEIARSEQRITVESVKRRFGKYATLVKGLENVDLREIARELKEELACGGTVKDNIIELQGNHLSKVKQTLIRLGFPESCITSQQG